MAEPQTQSPKKEEAAKPEDKTEAKKPASGAVPDKELDKVSGGSTRRALAK